jgi:Zn-dependent protease with chaperone function
MFKFLFLLFCFFGFGLAKAQSPYVPLDTSNTLARSEAAKIYIWANGSYLRSLVAKDKSEEARKVVETLNSNAAFYLDAINEGHFYYDQRISNKISKILEALRQNNPSIPANLQILLSKSPEVNAFCLHNGSIILNIGLFEMIENEDQLASIICHELGHYLLDHIFKIQLTVLKKELSEDYKKKIKQIKKQKYNRSLNAFNLYREELYLKGEQSKIHEYEADSIGYVLFKNSKYNKFDFLKMLHYLDHVGRKTEKQIPLDFYPKIFNLPKLAFKNDWMTLEEFNDYDYSFIIRKMSKDSIESHPKVTFRIEKLKKIFPELNSIDSKIVATDSLLLDFKSIAEHEQILNLYEDKAYGQAAYQCLWYIYQGKDTAFYKNWLGKCLVLMARAKDNYILNQHLEHISPKEHSASYKQFLSFMWNLNLEEMKTIGEFYWK